MKDLRDLMSMIDEKQYALDENADYFGGVYDAYNQIATRTVPDAVMPISQEMLKFEHKRKRTVAANLKKIQKEVLGEVNVYNDGTFVEYTGPGRASPPKN